jgi:hypothetical protein
MLVKLSRPRLVQRLQRAYTASLYEHPVYGAITREVGIFYGGVCSDDARPGFDTWCFYQRVPTFRRKRCQL